MKQAYKTIVLALLVLALSAGLLSGCGSSLPLPTVPGTGAAPAAEQTNDDAAAPGQISTESPTPAETAPAAVDPLAVYAALVLEKEAELGVGSLQGDGIYYMDGLGYIKLTDLNADGTEELLLAYGSMFQSTLEVYTVSGGEAKQLYQGPALQWGVDGCCVEIWEDEAGNRYLPVNKGDYVDGMLSFLRFDGAELSEARAIALYEAWDSDLHQVESDGLNFGSSDPDENRAWVKYTQETLREVRTRLGLAEESSDPEPEGEATVLAEDEMITVTCLGKRMLHRKDGDFPCYLLRIHNRSDSVLNFMNGHPDVNYGTSYGEANGAKLIALYFTLKRDPEPEAYRFGDEEIDADLLPGSDTELYLLPICAGTGLRTLEELVNVTANVHISRGTGASFWYRNYVLELNMGESAPALPEGWVDCETRYCSFTIPAAWAFEISGENDDYGLAIVSVPQAYSDRGFSYLNFQYDSIRSAEEAARRTSDSYLADNASQGNYSVSRYDTVLDGRTLKTVEVVGKASDNRFRFYYLDLPDGKTLSITTSAELKYEDALRDDFEAILNSIQFH